MFVSRSTMYSAWPWASHWNFLNGCDLVYNLGVIGFMALGLYEGWMKCHKRHSMIWKSKNISSRLDLIGVRKGYDLRDLLGLGWLPSYPFPAQCHRAAGVALGKSLQTECPKLTVSWIHPMQGIGLEGEGREGEARYFSLPCQCVRQWLFLRLPQKVSICSISPPWPSCQGWEWLLALVNFWTTSWYPVEFLVLPSLMECIKVSA